MNDSSDTFTLETRLVALEVRTEERHKALLSALEKADEVLQVHLAALNNVATQLREERGSFVRRDWLESQLEVLKRTVWIGVGAWSVVVIALQLLTRLLFR